MLTRDDLIDLIIDAVRRSLTNAPSPEGAKSGKPTKEKPIPKGRLFLSEYDIRQRLTPGGKRLTIPKDAIISPLASDWLVLKGIEVVRE